MSTARSGRADSIRKLPAADEGCVEDPAKTLCRAWHAPRMNARVWLLAIPIGIAVLPLVYWVRAKKWIAVAVTAALTLTVVTVGWLQLRSHECSPGDEPQVGRYKDYLPSDGFCTGL